MPLGFEGAPASLPVDPGVPEPAFTLLPMGVLPALEGEQSLLPERSQHSRGSG
jgi:hypothetical protein